MCMYVAAVYFFCARKNLLNFRRIGDPLDGIDRARDRASDLYHVLYLDPSPGIFREILISKMIWMTVISIVMISMRIWIGIETSIWI